MVVIKHVVHKHTHVSATTTFKQSQNQLQPLQRCQIKFVDVEFEEAKQQPFQLDPRRVEERN